MGYGLTDGLQDISDAERLSYYGTNAELFLLGFFQFINGLFEFRIEIGVPQCQGKVGREIVEWE